MTTDLFDLSSIGISVEPPTSPEKKFSTLIYGRMRTGKSTLAATCADVESMAPVLWIAAEDGTASFADKYPEIDVVHPKSFADIASIVSTLTEWTSDTDRTPKNPTKYKTIVVDTLGQVQEIIKADYTAKKGSMDYEGWAKIADGIEWLVDELHNSPYNSIFIAHTERIKDDTLGGMLHMPYFLGKKAIVQVPKIIDNIMYLAKVEGENGKMHRVLQVSGSSRVDAGSRFEHKFPETGQLVDTNFQEIFNYITK